MIRHHYACNCRECDAANLWQGAVVTVIAGVLFVSGLAAVYKSGLFAWLTN